MTKKICNVCGNLLFKKSIVEFKNAPDSAQNFNLKKNAESKEF